MRTSSLMCLARLVAAELEMDETIAPNKRAIPPEGMSSADSDKGVGAVKKIEAAGRYGIQVHEQIISHLVGIGDEERDRKKTTAETRSVDP